MDLGTASQIVERVLAKGRHGSDQIRVRENFTGLGMPGARTTGIEVNSLGLLYDIGMAAAELRSETEPYDVPDVIRIENAGFGGIVY